MCHLVVIAHTITALHRHRGRGVGKASCHAVMALECEGEAVEVVMTAVTEHEWEG